MTRTDTGARKTPLTDDDLVHGLVLAAHLVLSGEDDTYATLSPQEKHARLSCVAVQLLGAANGDDSAHARSSR